MSDKVLSFDSLEYFYCVLHNGLQLYKYKGWYYIRFTDLFGNDSFIRFGRI